MLKCLWSRVTVHTLQKIEDCKITMKVLKWSQETTILQISSQVQMKEQGVNIYDYNIGEGFFPYILFVFEANF